MSVAAARVAASNRTARQPARTARVTRAPKQKRRPARRRTAAASFVKAMCVAAAITGLAMVTLSQRVLIAQNGIAISQLERQIQSERIQGQRLSMALLVLESPARIQRQAETRLRMVAPEEVSYMQIPLERPQAATRMVSMRHATDAPTRPRPPRQGILETLLEKVMGHVQLLPLGNVGMPLD